MNIPMMLLNDFIIDEHPEELEGLNIVELIAGEFFDEYDFPEMEQDDSPIVDLSDLPW
jgi:hypothetical protein